MGRFDIDEATAAEWDEKFKDAVRPKLDEEVLAVGPFRHTGAGTRMGISKAQLGAGRMPLSSCYRAPPRPRRRPGACGVPWWSGARWA